MKICSKCHQQKPKEAFFYRKDIDGLSSECRKCKSDYKKQWYQLNKHLPEIRHRGFISQARQRNLDNTLSKQEYIDLLDNCCFYCEMDISSETGSGLDRLNNDRGYHLDNVVPCCRICNLGKGNLFTSKEWKVMIQALIKWRKTTDSNRTP